MGRVRTEAELAYHRRAMKAYRAAAAGKKCSRCGDRPLKNLRRCPWCLAQDSERRHPDKRHATRTHAMLIFACHQMDTKCAASGFTLRELLKAGMHLEVDRIDASHGYLASNMQVVCSYLNRMKGREAEWPDWCVQEVAERVALAGRDDEVRAWMPEGEF